MHPIVDTQYLLDIGYEPTPELPGTSAAMRMFHCRLNLDPAVTFGVNAKHCADAWDLKPRSGLGEASQRHQSSTSGDARGVRHWQIALCLLTFVPRPRLHCMVEGAGAFVIEGRHLHFE